MTATSERSGGAAVDRRGVSLTEVDTPALRLDIGRFERNVGRLSASLRRAGVAWRPHSKAHKSPELAKSQIAAGAIGVTCAKVSEAEVMVDHGIGSVLIANELPLRAKLDRVARLERRAEVIVCADAPTHVEIASAAAQALGVQIPVMVDVDVGLGRTGVRSAEAARTLAWLIERAQGLRFAGLMGYEGQLAGPLETRQAMARERMGRLIDSARYIERDGLTVPILTAGSSGSFLTTAHIKGITEIQAGGACLMDLFYAEECHLADEGYEYALTVVASVTSRPAPDQVIVDAGFKTMSNRGAVFPRAIGQPGLEVVSLSAEHGTARATGDAQRLRIGDRVEFVPAYSDTTTFLHDHFIGTRGTTVDHIIPLLARGRLT